MQYTISFRLNVTGSAPKALKRIENFNIVFPSHTQNGSMSLLSLEHGKCILRFQIPSCTEEAIQLRISNAPSDLQGCIMLYNLCCSINRCVIIHSIIREKESCSLNINICATLSSDAKLLSQIDQQFRNLKKPL